MTSRPARLKSTGPRRKALGLVWLKYPRSTSYLRRLGKKLRVEAGIHRGQEPPADVRPSAVILCSNGEDVGPEVRRLQTLVPDVPVLVMDQSVDLLLARAALQAGARGFIYAGMNPEKVVRAISVAQEGEIVLPRRLFQNLLAEGPRLDVRALTHRQVEILKLVAAGLSNAQISRRLYLSESTVKQHLRTAYKVMGVKNRNQATALLRQEGFG